MAKNMKLKAQKPTMAILKMTTAIMMGIRYFLMKIFLPSVIY